MGFACLVDTKSGVYAVLLRDKPVIAILSNTSPCAVLTDGRIWLDIVHGDKGHIAVLEITGGVLSAVAVYRPLREQALATPHLLNQVLHFQMI